MTQPTADRLAWFDRSDRVRVEVSGPDRAKFLHNLTTNDVKRLAAGSGQESFVTSPQGKTLAYVTLLATDRAILVRSDPGTAESFVPHLRKYGVFDDVEIDDVTAESFESHLVGPDADRTLGGLGLDVAGLDRSLRHVEAQLDGHAVRVVREGPTGAAGWTILGPAGARDTVRAALEAAGAVAGDAAEFEALRIAAGTPTSGLDVRADNLPQEVGRDARAISFVKGCYLGQETVARLDALGHVNKILKGGTIAGAATVPAPGTPLVGPDDKPAGTITSAAIVPGGAAVVFLAYVRVAQAVEGTRLAIPSLGDAVAVVADLPAPV